MYYEVSTACCTETVTTTFLIRDYNVTLDASCLFTTRLLCYERYKYVWMLSFRSTSFV